MGVGKAKGMTFRSLRGTEAKTALVLAIPMMRNPESGKVFSIVRAGQRA